MRRLIWIVVAALAACGFPKLRPVGDAGGGDGNSGSDGGGSDRNLLTAIDEPYGYIGATITLEGVFTDPLVVHFPGVATASATLLGPNRATVDVPATATAGRLSVGASSMPFRATTWYPSLSEFDDNYHQPEYARAMPQYTTSHSVTIVSDDYVYVLGGAVIQGGAPVAADTVARAHINADDTIDDFAVTSQHLLAKRAWAASARSGDTTYLIGGADDQNRYLDTIESVTLAADGTFAFATLPVKLTTVRFDPACAVIGDWLYVIGGKDATTHALRTIERAQINSDGSLGAFAVVSTQLGLARYGAASAVRGAMLFVVGGADETTAHKDAEQLPIDADGSLEPSVTTGATLYSGRIDAYAIVLGNVLWVIGGETDTSGHTSATVDSGVISSNGSVGSFAGGDPSYLATARGGFAAARVGKKLYLIGGSADGGATTLASIEYADLNNASDLFQDFGTAPVATLVKGRHGHASVVIGSWLYMLGGFDSAGDLTDAIERAPIALDGTIGAFVTYGQTLFEACAQPNIAVIGGTLYVIGGQTASRPKGTANIEKATIMSDGGLSAFTLNQQGLPFGRYGATAAVIDGYTIVFGGKDADPAYNGNPSPDGVYAADGSGSLGMFDAASVQLGHAAYGATVVVTRHHYDVVLGGYTQVQSSTVTVSTSTGLSMSSFTDETKPPAQRTNGSSVWTGDALFLLGGTGSDGSDQSSIDFGAPTTGTFFPFSLMTISVMLPKPLSGQTSIVLGNYLYTLGGISTGTTQSGVFSATLK